MSEPENIAVADASTSERSRTLKEGMHKTAKQNALNSQIAQYMFWGATTLLGMAIGAPFFAEGTLTTVANTLGVGTAGLLTGMGGVSAATLAGSIYFSESAAEQSENNDLLYSKKQALDIAKAIKEEHANAPVIVTVPAMASQENPQRPDGKSWAEATTANRGHGIKPEQWAEYVAERKGNTQTEITL